MIDLSKYISEELNRDNQKRLSSLVSDGTINDGNFETIYKEVQKISKMSGLDSSACEAYMDQHGLSELRWNRGETAYTTIVQLFSKNGNLDALSSIVAKGGAQSVYVMPQIGNIFEKPKEQGWLDEAKTMALMTNSKSANAGPCELLLKFMLKEGNSRSVGDVGIDSDEMEVKAITKNEKGTSGGHAAGQRGDIQPTWTIYYTIDRELTGSADEKEAKKRIYLQKENGVKDLNQLFSESGKTVDELLDAILNGVLVQYNFREYNSKGELVDVAKNFSKINYRKLRDSFLNYLKPYTDNRSGIKNHKELFNAVGAAQLYLYATIEEFNYLFCVYIDKTEKDQNSGKYIMFRDIQSGNTDLSDVSVALKELVFGPLDSATSTQGRTGKIGFRK